jgi:hypothetical protein
MLYMVKGRDSLLLEMQIGSCNLSMFTVCMLITHYDTYSYMERMFGDYFTMQVWATLWVTCGVSLIVACWYRHRPCIEWFSMSSCAMWGVVSYKSLSNFQEFPTMACISPVICLFSGIVYMYHMRVSHLARINDRLNTIAVQRN